MAAFMCSRRILSSKCNLLKAPKRLESGFIVLLPEIGEDLPEKNPLLKEDTLLPEFNSLTIEKCIAAIGKQTVEFEQGIKQVEKTIEASKSVNFFKEVLEPIENLEIPLQTTWGISKVLYFGNQSLMPSKCYYNIHDRAYLANATKYNSLPIYEACKNEIKKQNPELTNEERRILTKMVVEGKLNGLELSEKDKLQFQLTVNTIYNRQEEFRQKLEIATNIFKHKIKDANMMKEFPDDFLKNVAVDPKQYREGPWIITLNPHIVSTFLEYCPQSLSRWNIWQASVLKCSGYGDHNIQTSSIVNGITTERCEIAVELGFKHYSDLSMTTKMAGSLKEVYTFLDTLLERAYPLQVQEIESLRKFAKEHGGAENLQQWDLLYWARKQKKVLYNYDEEDLRKYFPLPKVLNGIFGLIKELFDIDIVQRNNVNAWHQDIIFYDVYDLEWSKSEPMGSFYFDPYARSNEKKFSFRNSGYVLLIRNKSDVCQVKPLSSLIYNFQPPTEENPSLLSFKEVKSLFENFGTLLNQLISKVRYADVAGLQNVEWDAVNTSKHFMSHWAYNPDVLKNISNHYHTNEPISDEMIKSINNARTHMTGYNTCKELYLSRFDLELHSERKIWEKIMKKLWKQHFVMPEDKKDSHICSFEEIFTGNLGAAYYGDLWSKMLGSDIFSAFEESSNDKEQQKIIGKRYKDTYFSLGGSVEASETFRRFRGRDPSIKAFLKSLNFK